MWSRRELLRATTLGGLVVAAPTLFAGCSGDDSAPLRARASSGPAPAGGLQLVSSKVARRTVPPDAVGAGAASVLTLAAGLYQQLFDTTDNLALSPFSAAVALGMTANGAAGRTRTEMLTVLGAHDLGAQALDAVDDGLNGVSAYVESLAGPVPGSDDEIALATANQLFGQAGTRWQQAFLDALATSFGAGLREVDFVKDTEAARTAINGWTSDQTHGRIPAIVPEGALSSLTRMVLVNALYFKAPWQVPFEKGRTADGSFTAATDEQVSVPMMKGTAGYSEGDGWRAAHLAYAGGDLAMTVVQSTDDANTTVDTLVSDGHLPLMLAAASGEVELTMPRFTFLTAVPLSRALEAMGMTTAFTDSADFSAMTTDDALSLSAVLQQVFIAVDESGTEAAAATAVVAGVSSAQLDPPAPLVLDRPFLFVVHDTAHGVPLFLGKVADPTA